MNFRSIHSYNVVVDVRCYYAIKSECAQFNFFLLFFYFCKYKKKNKEKIPLHIKIFIEHEITTAKYTILLITQSVINISHNIH